MTAQSNITPESIVADLRYLQLLSRSFPTIAAASTEIINLEAILNLPKGTEHFLTDIHGEYEAFQHVLKNASGAVKRKVNEIFGHTLREIEKKELCTLIYYPEEKLQLIKATETDIDDWYLITLNQLVKVCQNVSSKYTRSKVRKSLPAEFSYIIQELLHESTIEPNKHAYINVIISTIISTRRADDFIIAMCNLIQRLTIDSLHIVGDIYDRGPGAHIIMDTLCDYHNFDIQWGNHDILWMGATLGNQACIATVVRNSARYNNIGTLEDAYGINIRPLSTFAQEAYKNDNCETMLMRFFRGTGVKGLGGISPVRGNIIRPLITVDRNSIEKYCNENNLNYCTDSTNNDTEYTRNKIRHNIIPLIEKEFNPSIVDAMYKTAEIMAGEEEYMDRQARMAYSYCAVGDKVLSVEKLLDLDKVILKRVLRLGFIDFSADLHDVSYEHIKSVESLLYKKNGKVVQLPHNLRASRINNCIIFSKHIEHKEVLYKLEPEEPKYIPEIGKTLLISKKNLTNPKILYTISFDYDKIKGDFYFRNRKAGDKIYLNGVGGRKSLKKIFSELKLSKDDKDSITLLAVDNDVLWIPNYKTSDMYKANEDTKNVVYMYLKEKEN